MSTYYSRDWNDFEFDYGTGHQDALIIRKGDVELEFWTDEIDKLIQAIRELKYERERIKEIEDEFEEKERKQKLEEDEFG